jgi:hypothetical protein
VTPRLCACAMKYWRTSSFRRTWFRRPDQQPSLMRTYRRFSFFPIPGASGFAFAKYLFPLFRKAR